MHLQPAYTGWVEVISGPMFSGKSEELIRRLKRSLYANQKIQVFKPVCDNRYADSAIVTHEGMALDSTSVDRSDEILAAVDDDTEVVGIDEAQFFDAGMVEVVEKLALEGKRVIVAGLDQDYLGVPFEPIPRLMAIAEYVTKTLSICMICGNPAVRSYRLTEDDSRVLVGTVNQYEARCRKCHHQGLMGKDEGQKLPQDDVS